MHVDQLLNRIDDREAAYLYGMTKLVLKWSAEANCDAFSAAGTEEVSISPTCCCCALVGRMASLYDGLDDADPSMPETRANIW